MKPWMFLSSFLLGLWLIAAPVTFGYQSDPLFYSDLGCGLALICLGVGRYTGIWVSWGLALIGCWLGLAPLVFWAPTASCYLNDTLCGLLILALFTQLPTIANGVPDTGPAIPPGWSYNPSSWPQRLPILLLALIGWLASRYMAAYQLGYIDHIEDPFFGDGTVKVITSAISQKFPVPDAGLGALAYSLELIATCKGGERRWRTEPWMVILFGLLAIPVSLTSVCLILLQPLIVGSWCSFCLLTAFCMLTLVVLSIDEVTAVLQYLIRSKEKPFWQLLFEGGPCQQASEDRKTPSLQASWSELGRAAKWGVTLPWNLLASVGMGMVVMAFPNQLQIEGTLANVDHIFGPLTIVISMISLSEITRKVRLLNLLFAAIILIVALFEGHLIAHASASLLIGLMAIRAGPIRDAHGFSKKL